MLHKLDAPMGIAGLQGTVVGHAIADDITQAGNHLAACLTERVECLLEPDNIFVDTGKHAEFHS